MKQPNILMTKTPQKTLYFQFIYLLPAPPQQ